MGEFFFDFIYKNGDLKLENYFEDCCLVIGLLMLVDGISYCKDKEFVMGIEKLLMEIDCLDMEM